MPEPIPVPSPSKKVPVADAGEVGVSASRADRDWAVLHGRRAFPLLQDVRTEGLWATFRHRVLEGFEVWFLVILAGLAMKPLGLPPEIGLPAAFLGGVLLGALRLILRVSPGQRLWQTGKDVVTTIRIYPQVLLDVGVAFALSSLALIGGTLGIVGLILLGGAIGGDASPAMALLMSIFIALSCVYTTLALLGWLPELIAQPVLDATLRRCELEPVSGRS